MRNWLQQWVWRDLPAADGIERWVFVSIAYTFGFYFVGALYLVAPVLGWTLLARIVAHRWWTAEPTKAPAPLMASLWLCASLGMLLALVVGHVQYDLGFGKIVKSSIGWAKGWALITVFLLIGMQGKIRIAIIIRATCVVGLMALMLAPILIIAWLVSLPGFLYVSPLKILGGSGPEFFTVILYEIDPGNGSPRWRFFAPWAPAVGFVANIYLLCALYEKDRTWRVFGIVGNALMIILAASRMGMLVMLLIPTAVFFLTRLTRPWVLVLSMLTIMLIALNFEFLFLTLTDLLAQIKGARADSTRVRAALNDIALYRWYTEAWWFGHGVVEPGSHLVEFMPIGTHHNWYGLLFVKGFVGLVSFALPFVLTGIALLLRAQVQREAGLALGAFLVLTFFSLSENIEALAYMTWPAWLLIGIALREPLQSLNWQHLLIPSHLNHRLETRHAC